MISSLLSPVSGPIRDRIFADQGPVQAGQFFPKSLGHPTTPRRRLGGGGGPNAKGQGGEDAKVATSLSVLNKHASRVGPIGRAAASRIVAQGVSPVSPDSPNQIEPRLAGRQNPNQKEWPQF